MVCLKGISGKLQLDNVLRTVSEVQAEIGVRPVRDEGKGSAQTLVRRLIETRECAEGQQNRGVLNHHELYFC